MSWKHMTLRKQETLDNRWTKRNYIEKMAFLSDTKKQKCDGEINAKSMITRPTSDYQRPRQSSKQRGRENAHEVTS